MRKYCQRISEIRSWSSLPLQRLPLPLPQVRRRLIRALHEVEQRLVRRSGGTHRVVVEQKLPDIRVVSRALRRDRRGAKSLRLGIRIGIERRLAVAAVAGPEADARAFVG